MKIEEEESKNFTEPSVWQAHFGCSKYELNVTRLRLRLR